MTDMRQIAGSLKLAGRTAASLAQIAGDSIRARTGGGLPQSREAIARPDALNDLIHQYPPRTGPALPEIKSASLAGVDFESSNCTNFLVNVEFVSGEVSSTSAAAPLPKTLYVKLPVTELATRSFAHTLGFWDLECEFCENVASEVPIRVPRVYASARQGAQFALLLENLHETPGTRLFLNRDMAEGTTPERAARVLETFAELHAYFWDRSETERESLLPAHYNTFTAPRWREVTRALNASALTPAQRAAPDLIPDRLADTYRRAIERWDSLIEAWYDGPLTLVHGDSHLGNCFEYETPDGIRVGLIDFQAPHWSKGMRDVQYFMINSLASDVLEANESALIQGYCDALGRHGVTLSFEDAFEQYRAFSFQTLTVGVVPLGLGSLTERDETVLAITKRSAAAVERLGFREWMDGLP